MPSHCLLVCAIFLALLAAVPARAKDWTGYKEISLDAIDAQADKIARAEETGVSLVPFENVHFVTRYAAAPAPCPTGLLDTIFTMRGKADILKRISVHQCIGLASSKGRPTKAFIQDVLGPGLKSDAKLGGEVEIWAVLTGFVIEPNKADSHPILIVNRFEPK